ncbi:MAG: KH domain-containing protein [Candidatus Pacebacteria bacterium]|nr:KH domain-containing protein [Candidatus Paceibacterota bacterium]
MKNLLEYLLIHLVDYPEDVIVEENETERGFEYLLKVNPEDMGRVIGKRGAVIESIRSIAKVRAVKEGIKVFIKLED